MSEPLSAEELTKLREYIAASDLFARGDETIARLLATLAAARPPDPDALREALLDLRRTDMPDGPCWCSVAPNRTVQGHESKCRAARAALAAPAAPPPDEVPISDSCFTLGCYINRPADGYNPGLAGVCALRVRTPDGEWTKGCAPGPATPDLAALLHPWTCTWHGSHPDTDGGWFCQRAAADIAFRLGQP